MTPGHLSGYPINGDAADVCGEMMRDTERPDGESQSRMIPRYEKLHGPKGAFRQAAEGELQPSVRDTEQEPEGSG